MLRQRSSEVMDRTCRTRRLPDNIYYLVILPIGYFRARQRGVGADGWRKLYCEHGESVNRRGMQVRRKETAKLRGGGCIFSSEWARTFPGIRASKQSAAKAYCVACNTHFGIGHGGRHDVKRHIERQHTSQRLSHVWAASIGLSLLAAKSTGWRRQRSRSRYSLPSTTCRWPLGTSLG